MQVLSPVGRFQVRAHGLHVQDGHLAVAASLGAWKSEVTLERTDFPLIVAALVLACGALAGAFGLGRYTAVGRGK